MYYVWRRSDGYVAATNGHKPQDHGIWTFEVLLETTDWPTAQQLIKDERAKDGYPQFTWATPEAAR